MAPVYPAMTEAELQAWCLGVARALGYLVYHTWDSRKSEPGYPDLTIVGFGHVIFVELKTEKGQLTSEQELWLYYIDQCPSPIHSAVVRPSNREGFRNFLERIRLEH